ncbi:ABC transporter ATP-binding protein [Mycoplasmoides pirum]|uniref:ABC transporter ATP-binding protein n=1 Tax=Mycoplasmoides pirum TaxID=2122 RepID=UPI00055CBF51|nr:ABC transporter ATP-binding protein [Mycoplasmoides pirum]
MKNIKINISYLKMYSFFELKNINLEIKKNSICSWIGNNGSGKTTLINLLIKNYKCENNMIFIDDLDINKFSYKNLSKFISYVPQINSIYPELSVWDFVCIGRLPYTNFLGFLKKEDKKIINEILETLNILDLKDRKIGSLSGGQKQKVIIANALVQETPIIILDEPLNHLDVEAQDEIIKLILELKNKLFKTIIVVLHNFEIAANISDYIACFFQGSIPLYGTPKEVITSENIKKYFGVNRTIYIENNKFRIFD